MKRLVQCVFMLSLAVAASLAYTNPDQHSLDEQLITALAENNLRAARSALKKGANPEASHGRNVLQDAMCAAIELRGTEALELLLEFGADPNFFYPERHIAHRTPLACAIRYSNEDAFYLLLNLGVDTEVELCTVCAEPHYDTAFSQSLVRTHWPMALHLARTTPIDEREMATLKRKLGRQQYHEGHPWNRYREELIAWVQERDPDFVARPAYPLQPGEEPYCVQSYRDQLDGVLPGSICPE